MSRPAAKRSIWGNSLCFSKREREKALFIAEKKGFFDSLWVDVFCVSSPSEVSQTLENFIC